MREPVVAAKDRFLRGMALAARGRLAGDTGDLRAAVEDLQAAADVVPADDPISPAIAGTLGGLLNDRHLMLGLHADADAGRAMLARALASLDRHAVGDDREIIVLFGLMARGTAAVRRRDADELDRIIPELRPASTRCRRTIRGGPG